MIFITIIICLPLSLSVCVLVCVCVGNQINSIGSTLKYPICSGNATTGRAAYLRTVQQIPSICLIET